MSAPETPKSKIYRNAFFLPIAIARGVGAIAASQFSWLGVLRLTGLAALFGLGKGALGGCGQILCPLGDREFRRLC